MRKIFTLFLLCFSFAAFSQSTTVVISQVYGGGGGSTGTYMFDYVELHNISGSVQSLTGTSIQYGSATGNFGATTTNIFAFPAGTSIPAGGYLLIQLGSAGSAGAALPVTPDFTTTNLSMGAASGKVVLANQTAGLGCGATAGPCTLPAANIIDVVSYGASNNAEGGATVNNGVALTSTQAAVRKTNGCTETDNNNNDFNVVTAPVPRNSASPVVTCGAVATITATPNSTAFGAVCINTNGGPNSFTISGTNLNTTNVTVAALSGYTYSTTSTGTYTATLSLGQGGGTYSQQIFVRFTPTAVTTYNGNIVIGGGGASSVNVAASGSGINTAPSVTSGTASAITSNSATVSGTITSTGCSAVTSYGIEWSTTNNFPNGTGTAVASSNLTGGNFSSNLTGLPVNTTIYFHAYATNGGGTVYGAQGSFMTSNAPSLGTNPATIAFGNVCINTTAGPNSFTINGSNLSNANVTVGPLAGYTFSTASSGPYSTSLTLTQPGGTYSQAVFVQFTPTAVQSYSGNIPVSGGGAATVNVAASGAGVNTAPSVSTGAASSVTQTTVTVAGTISSTGCSAVTAYGAEYSTTTGFTPGTGTVVNASNLSGGAFSANLTGLSLATTYYYRAFATNGAGTTYGNQQSFTTQSAILTLSALPAFGGVCVNTTAGPNTFTISSSLVNASNITVAALAGYTYSLTANGTYTSTLSISHPAGAFSQIVYVKFTPVALQAYNGNILVSGGGASGSVAVAASGSGVNTGATVTTNEATNITRNSATLNGTVATGGCNPVTEFGYEYTGIPGLANGLGTVVRIPATNAAGDSSVTLRNLVPGTTYYFKAYAVTSSGKVYGAEKNFTTLPIAAGLIVYNSPVRHGEILRYSLKVAAPAHYTVSLISISGQVVFSQGLSNQVNSIDGGFKVPGQLPQGAYVLMLKNTNTGQVTKKQIMIL